MRSSLFDVDFDSSHRVAMLRSLATWSAAQRLVEAETCVSPVGSHRQPRYRRRRYSRRTVTVLLTVFLLLVTQASVAGGLAAESDRKSRRKLSPSVVESPYAGPLEVYRRGEVIDSPSSENHNNISAVGRSRRESSFAEPPPRLFSSSSSLDVAAMASTMATTAPTTTRRHHDERFVNPKPGM